MKKSIYFIFLLIFLFSCKKKEITYDIKGIITDNTFNVPLENAEVNLYQVVAGTQQKILISSMTTSSDGSYAFSAKKEKAESFYVEVIKPNYFSNSSLESISNLSTEKDNIINIETTAKSWVNLHFYHPTNNNVNQILVTKQKGKQDCDECCSKEEFSLSGIIDTNIYCINDGNTEYSYLYKLVGTSTVEIKSIVTQPFDTVELFLQY